MSKELIAIIEQLEREKGVKKEVLLEAVESGLVIVARKTLGLKSNEEVKVKIDPDTGKIRVLKQQEEIKSLDFANLGRIAASIARQVIIQKIREAEKEAVYNEFKEKIGQIISGTVYRFERGNIILDLLEKTEGIIYKNQQVKTEEFKQGQRIRAYVLDVKKEGRVQVILSRTHANLVKKLFELEVPEIIEGIVEIKAISRIPGERTKIAVWSKNEKVDPVGACVGMRGNRVRNIVNELQGEKIDIVRYHDDIREFIKASLSPAELKEIRLDKENKKAEVIVEEDQLSLAIGKHGQNVRLASKLVGWELDIRTPQTAGLTKEEKDKLGRIFKQQEEETLGLDKLGISKNLIDSLQRAGFNSIAQLAEAKVEDLLKVKGIGKKRAEKIIELVNKYLNLK